MRVTIHQPNFVPWLPFFRKMAAADVLVLLTWCQWEKGGYQNRFSADSQWWTMGVKQGLNSIRAKRYRQPEQDWDRIVSRWPQLGRFGRHCSDVLWEMNAGIIADAARLLGIDSEIVTDSHTTATGSDRLLEICQRHGATIYISGPSGRKYLDVGLFERAGIEVEFFQAADADKVPLVEVMR